MKIFLHKTFKKKYQKLSKSQQEKFKARRNLFLVDEFDPLLNNHALVSKYTGYRSFNVTGDLRVVFKKTGDKVIFVTIDNHSNLYG